MVHTPFVPGQIVTAAQMNTIAGAWTSYTPVWTAATTNPAIGNGTITGRWKTLGDNLVIGQINITTSTSGTTTFGSGSYSWSLPVAASSAQLSFFPIGQAYVFKGSGGGEVGGTCRLFNSTTVQALAAPTTGSGTVWSSTVPLTWSTSSFIFFALQFIYEPA